MKNSKSILLVLITILIGISLVIGGCSTTAKKPAENYTKTPATPKTPTTPQVVKKPVQTLPNTPVTPNTTSTAYPKDVANRVADAAGKVEGVNKATAVVSGKVIYVGLDLKSNLGKMTSAEIEKKVMDKVKNMESGYTVSVTSDIDTVTRIKNVAMGITQGKPISSFKNELENINTRLTPKSK